MTPSADAIKKLTLERYDYLAEDNISGYDQMLRIAQQQPDTYWENQATAQK
jgi:hypothetical protein